MKKINLILTVIILLQNLISNAQNSNNYTWFNPSESIYFEIEGQGWPNNVASDFDRLDSAVEHQVRKPVWNLSKHAAGVIIRFKSSSPEIKVRYQVKGAYAMSHMPATGVSGLDLYAKNNKGKFEWYRGNYAFKDTIQYTFRNLNSQDKKPNQEKEYQLYLPLYNAISWLQIGIPKNDSFKSIEKRDKKPLVIYGTSIAQGACASRPGMAWTAILERKMDRPLINLGFSGNGKLESEMIEIINSIDAKVYILDCLPNLILNKDRTAQDVNQLIIEAVKNLRRVHKNTPILLVDHAGYSDGLTDKSRFKAYMSLNEINHKAFQELRSENIKNIYLLDKDSLNLGMEDFVDGTHPTDLGMMKYADAYEKKINEILNANK